MNGSLARAAGRTEGGIWALWRFFDYFVHTLGDNVNVDEAEFKSEASDDTGALGAVDERSDEADADSRSSGS